MEPLSLTALDLLGRDPSPALPMDRMRALMAGESPGGDPDGTRLLEKLADGSGRLRVLVCPKRRWCTPVGPRAWILAGDRPRVESPPLRPLLARMRLTLRHLGRAVEPDSALAWARWTRLLEEEARVRTILTRRPPGESASPTPPGAPAAPRKPIRPRDPLLRPRNRQHHIVSPSRPTPPRGSHSE